MAEYGVHHATHGETRPSIFEVLGQENLLSGLRFSFNHVFKILAENFPEKFSLLHRYFDEGYTVVDSVFQYIHLRLKGGLFPETFYGLKRFPDPRLPDVSARKVVSWVFLSVVGPYLQSQLRALYGYLKDKHDEGRLNYKDFRKHLALIYLKMYPVYNFIWEMLVLCYYMAYALGKTDYHSLALHLMSTKLVPVTFQDMDADAWKSYIPKSQQRSLSTMLWTLINGFVGGITMAISVGAFFAQFIDWWYSQEGVKNKFMSLPAPPPPTQWPSDLPSDVCPLCRNKRTNDTALSSSGFVFCYPCIFRYIQDTHKCPITGYKSTTDQLIKIYHQE